MKYSMFETYLFISSFTLNACTESLPDAQESPAIVTGGIEYNSECSNAIRMVGLPKKWKDDHNYSFPLTVLNKHGHSIHHKRPEYDSNGQIIWTLGEYKTETLPILSCLNQDSQQLLHIIRNDFLHFPENKKPYNLSSPSEQFIKAPNFQADDVDRLIFKGIKKGGFFIEAGGKDFESESTSLYFELKHNWTGLIVEPHPGHYQNGLYKNRQVYSSNTCLSFEPRPSVLKYRLSGESTINKDGELEVQCLPLYSLLQALDNPVVNYMSLDIEGGEFQILQTIPWDKVDIEVMSIESHFLGIRSPGTLKHLITYLESRGYLHIEEGHEAQYNEAYSGNICFDDSGKRADCRDGDIALEYITNELFVRKDIAVTSGLSI